MNLQVVLYSNQEKYNKRRRLRNLQAPTVCDLNRDGRDFVADLRIINTNKKAILGVTRKM